jgi:hypothetical protein
MNRLPSPQAAEPLRALPVVSRLAPDHLLHLQSNNIHSPHVRAGEYVVIDTADREIQIGELFLFNMGGPMLWCVAREPEAIRAGRKDPEVPCAFVVGLDHPRTLAEAQRRLRTGGYVQCSDGPVQTSYLRERVIGRCIGLYQAPENGGSA